MLNAAKLLLQLSGICPFSKSGVSAMLAAPFFRLNVMNSCRLMPGFGFLAPIYPIFRETLQIFGPPLFWMPVFWQRLFRNAACLQLSVTFMRTARPAALEIQSLCSQKEDESKGNRDNGPPVKIKTFHRPGLREFFCLSWCIQIRICSHAPFSFQTRPCFVMVDVTWLARSREGWPGALTHNTARNRFFSELKHFGFPVATFSAFKLLLLELEAFGESFSFIFGPLTSWQNQCNILSLVAKSGEFLTPFPQIRSWTILPTAPPSPEKNRKLLHYQICAPQVWLPSSHFGIY